MVAAVNINAVKSKRLEMGDHSSLLAIHFGLKERVFHLTLLCIRNIGEVICPSRIPVSSSQSGICDSEYIPPLPIGSVEQTGIEKVSFEKIHISPAPGKL